MSSLAVGLVGLLTSTQAQLAQAEAGLERVEITGSLLRHIDGETSSPVTVLRASELKKWGITSMAQAMAWVSNNQGSLDLGNSVGGITGGKAEADLRGLSAPFGSSASRTLVLLNGRRLVNHPFDGASVDLYALPLAALDRIEILRDGASALYGTDAIGGVVNVILRREQKQAELSAETQGSPHGGGATRRFSLTGGFGDLAEQGLHTQYAVDLRQQNRLRAAQRSASRTGVLPGRDLSSGTSFPGWINGFDPAIAGGCTPPDSHLAADGSCAYDIAAKVDAIPQNEQRTALLRSEIKLAPTFSLSGEYLWSRNEVRPRSGAAPAAQYIPESSRHFPAGAPHFDPAQPDDALTIPDIYASDPTARVPGGLVFWRQLPAGERLRSNTTFTNRLMFELRGELVSGWELQSGLGRSRSRSTERVLHGFVADDQVQQGIWDGRINPFGPQTLDGQAALDAAQVSAPVQSGQSRQDLLDVRLRGDLFEMPGGRAALAVGVEHRRERTGFEIQEMVAQLSSLGLDATADTQGARQISAAYGEISLPLSRALELTAALRADRYSDVGQTLNPKLAFRYLATPSVVLRGGVSTGFRAPSLYEVHRPQTLGFTADAFDDPIYCAGGTAGNGAAVADEPNVCGVQFFTRNSGPTANGQPADRLKPEKSRQLNLGFVVTPARSWLVGFDFWQLSVDNLIGALPDRAVFEDPTRYAPRAVRCSQLPNGAGPGLRRDDFAACANTLIDPIAYIDLPNENLGGLVTRGVDLSLAWALSAGASGRWTARLDGTYVHSYRYQRERGGAYTSAVGRYADDAPIFRWQHALSLSWARADWTVTLAQRYKSSYQDQLDTHRVPSLLLHDLSAQWQVTTGWTLGAGVRNLFDRDPPLSLQSKSIQSGYDPRFADPMGRVLALNTALRF